MNVTSLLLNKLTGRLSNCKGWLLRICILLNLSFKLHNFTAKTILTTLLYCLSCDYFGRHSKRQKKFGDFTSSKNYQFGNLCSVTVQQATYTTPMSNKLNLMLGRHMVPFWSPSYIPSHSDSVSILLIVNLLFLLLSHDSFLPPLLLIFLILWYELTVVQNMLQETYNWHSAL